MVSHTPVEVEKLAALQRRRELGRRAAHFVPAGPEAVHVVELPRADWQAADRGRRLDHIWVTPHLGDRVARYEIAKAARGWERPSTMCR